MTLRGSVAYELTTDLSELFASPGSPMTLQNDGPSVVYLSTLERHVTDGAIRLNVNASVPWDADKPCWGRTLSGRAVVRATDNSGVITDPAAIAAAIIDQGLAAAIAAKIAITPLTSSSVILLRKFLYAPPVGEIVTDFDEFILDGVRYAYPLTYKIDGASGFRILKSQISAKNAGAAAARFTYYLQSPGGVIYALNTVRVAPGDVANLIVDYEVGTEAGVIGSGADFTPKLGVSTVDTDLNIDVDYLCGTFGEILPPTAHDATTLIQTASVPFGGSGAPPPAATLVFPHPVAIGDLVIIGLGFGGASDITGVSGLGVGAWNVIQSRPVGGTRQATLAWARATAAGTTVTVGFSPGAGRAGGHVVGWQLHGLEGVYSSQTMPNNIGTADLQTPSLDAVIKDQVYVGLTTRSAGGGVLSYTESPEPFTSTYDLDSVDNDTWIHAGLLIASNPETISRTTHMNGGVTSISVAAVFT